MNFKKHSCNRPGTGGTGLLVLAGMLLFSSMEARQTEPLMTGWEFLASEIISPDKVPVERSAWQAVDLPHDWSITGERKADAATSGGGGFFPSGIGWYRKDVEAPRHWFGRRVFVRFGGVMESATVWLNGKELGSHENGYLPFSMELTPHLRLGESNTLLVRTDTRAQPASRWYTGGGIYRPVRLDIVDPVHVPDGGIFVSAMDIFEVAATMDVEVTVANTGPDPVEAEVKVFMISPDDLPVAQTRDILFLKAGESRVYNPRPTIPHPERWSPASPTLYRAVVHVLVDGRLTDRREVTFGIRSIELSAEEGLRLNGEAVELIGANVHHDYGPLGAAAFEDAVRRKVRILKEAGYNAVRTAHNPPSEAFLKACDAAGLLVVDEAFDGWAVAKVDQDYHRFFEENWRRDLETLVRRDRNHPSVIFWSIGNEMYERGKPETVGLAREMVALVKELDPTRPVTAGLNGLGAKREWAELDPLFATLDVAGYNYELHREQADHERVPDRVIYASESYQENARRNWKRIGENTHVIGEFVWSGMDYLGEAGIGRVFHPEETVRAHWEGSHFPWHGALCGDIDLIGTRKPLSHYRNILWERGETLYMAVEAPGPEGKAWQPSPWALPPLRASWTWPGREGNLLAVEVYSRHEQVRLFTGFDLVAEGRPDAENGYRLVFEVPYQPGVLSVQGLEDEAVVETFALQTAGLPARISLKADTESAVADRARLVFVEVEILDAAGTHHPDAAIPVRYTVEGPAEIIAVGSGNLATEETYLANPRETYQGRALLVLRSTGEPGSVRVRAESGDLEGGSVFLQFDRYPSRHPK